MLMALFLALGIIIGVFSVVFMMDNGAVVTVAFLSWQFTAPLALVILLSIVSGMILTLLTMVPQAIREQLDAYAARREQRRTEAVVQTQTTTS